MSTRSSARNLFPPLDNPELIIRRRSSPDPTILNDFEMAAKGNGDLPVPDLRTMEELCQPSLNGRGGPIAPIASQATNFGLKNDMIQQVHNSCQFYGLPGDDANKHLDKFLHVTQSIKVNGVTDDALLLYLFPHSLTHHATAWFDRLPRNSINTFGQMAKMFLDKYFPPSMVTKLRNEITNFRQRPNESLFEAWERYNLSIDRCPNHNMLPVTQIDTFYNGLTLSHRDTINAVAGGTFMKRRPEECYDLIENMTAHHNDWDTSAQRSESSSSITSSFDTKIAALKAEMAEINKNLMRVLQPPLATIRTYMLREPIKGASHGQNPPLAYQALVYQAPVHQPQIPQPQVVTTNEFTNFMKANDAILKNMLTNMTSLTNSNLELKNMFGQFMKMNTVSSSGSETLPGNTITNPKEELKGITTRSGTVYQGPTIPSSSSSSSSTVVERESESTKDMVHPTNNGSTKDVQPPIVQTESLILNSEPVVAPIIKPVVAPNKLSLPDLSPTCMTIELADRLISRPVGVAEDVFVKVGTFHFPADFVVVDFDADPRVTLILRRSFLKTGRALIDVFEGELTLRVGKEAITFNLDQTSRYSANYNNLKVNRIDVIDMAWEEYSQEVLGFFDVIASGNSTPYYDPIVSTTSLTLTPFENSDFFLEEVDAFLALEDDPTSPKVNQYYLPVIIAKYLSVEEKTALITVLKSHKRAIAWKLSDIKVIDPKFCTHKILMEDDFEPTVQHQRRVNPKLLDAGLIYPISDSPWVSPIHCVPKKGGFIVVENEENELILTRLVTGWRVCIDYRKLNEATRKDHFPLPFMDQILERLAGNEYYCFLNGFSGYFQIPIDLKDQEKTTFTCPYGTFAYLCMPFGLCNAPGTFQRCMMAIFHNVIKKTMEVFMDDFSVFGNYFQTCLSYLEKMLKRCEDTNLCLNWAKSHFMVKEGIVLGRKISKNGIEVDKAKIEVIAKLPHPTTVKVLGQCQEKHFRPIHFASKTMTEAESNYTTTEKEMFAVVYAFEKFRSYLIVNKSIVYTDHSALKYLFAKKDSKARFLCLVLLLKEFTFKFAKVMLKFGVTYRLATPYHPQTSGQVEVSNRGLKRILERTVGENRASWSDKLDDALWAFRTAYKTPIGCTPYKLVYEKACHLPIQLNELRDQAYENSLIYKEKTKRLHDSKIKDCVFNIGDKVLLFNSILKILSGKLKSRWYGPFTISHVFPYGTVELS
nr:reverse transcriptase domain-containing protein [Tanacetum cinerariifolium]